MGSFNITNNGSNPSRMDIENGDACARVLPAPAQDLPTMPLTYLAILGLVVLSISLGSLKLR